MQLEATASQHSPYPSWLQAQSDVSHEAPQNVGLSYVAIRALDCLFNIGVDPDDHYVGIPDGYFDGPMDVSATPKSPLSATSPTSPAVTPKSSFVNRLKRKKKSHKRNPHKRAHNREDSKESYAADSEDFNRVDYGDLTKTKLDPFVELVWAHQVTRLL